MSVFLKGQGAIEPVSTCVLSSACKKMVLPSHNRAGVCCSQAPVRRRDEEGALMSPRAMPELPLCLSPPCCVVFIHHTSRNAFVQGLIPRGWRDGIASIRCSQF